MFKVYVVKQKRSGSEVLKDTRSATPSRAAAPKRRLRARSWWSSVSVRGAGSTGTTPTGA